MNTFEAAAQSTDVTAHFDSNLVETGELFTLALTVPREAGKPDAVDFQAWEADSVHLYNQSGWKPEKNFYVNHCKLITFDADTLFLPPLHVLWSNGQTAITDSLQLVVVATPSPDDLVGIEDIKEIDREPAIWTDYLPWIGVTSTLVLAAILTAWWHQRRKRRPEPVAPPVVEEPAHLKALRKLDALSRQPLLQNEQIKSYYAELTYIFREYVEKRYGIPALESVSSEIMDHLHRAPFPRLLLPPVREMLQMADQVKFAKSIPPDTFHQQARQLVKEVVTSTANVP